MGRKPRIWFEGACYHVMARGNRRSVLFADQEDFTTMLSLLGRIQADKPFILHAFCLMTNHFHLEITTPEIPIWEIMMPLMQCFAIRYNRKYGYEGHVFDSRYTSCLITSERYFLETSRYIHLNPVKAGIVKDPLEYRYSSYRSYILGDEAENGGILDTSRVLDAFFQNSRDRYREFVEEQISHEEDEQQIRKAMKEDDWWLPR